MENTNATPRLLDLAEKTEVRYEVVDSILEIRQDANDGLFLHIR